MTEREQNITEHPHESIAERGVQEADAIKASNLTPLNAEERIILDYRLRVLEEDEHQTIMTSTLDPDTLATDTNAALVSGDRRRLLHEYEERDLTSAYPRIRTEIDSIVAALKAENAKGEGADKDIIAQLEADHQSLTELQNRNVHQIISRNSGLAVTGAMKRRSARVELPDLIQEGKIGLLLALDKFDPELGYRFSTYATFWIRQNVGRSVSNTGQTIRIPVHMGDFAYKLHKMTHQLAMSLGREPTTQEIAKAMDTSEETVETAQHANNIKITSLNEIVTTSEGKPLERINIIPDPQVDIESEGEKTMLISDIQNALAKLNERERTVIELRFGLRDGQRRTFAEIGQECGMTRQRAQQIEREALHKFKQIAKDKNLDAYL